MFESKGWLRTIGSALSSIGGVLILIENPTCKLVGTILLQIGVPIGGVGVVRAGAAKLMGK